ncbi:MAG: hypothetical protein ABR512_13430 [Desulfopila sp.]
MIDIRTLNTDKDRFTITQGTQTMKAVVTTGHGGYEQLDYRDVPIPQPAQGEVLVQVVAAGVNNTEINTRLGWYSSSVTTVTDTLGSDDEEKTRQKADGGWNEATPYPLRVKSRITGDETDQLARRLFRKCPCPVWIIRNSHQNTEKHPQLLYEKPQYR